MILVTILTSRNLDKLQRCIQSFESQTCKNFDYNIVVNTLDKQYEKRVISLYPSAHVTQSNGSPGKGKNSVVDLWRNSNSKYTHFSLIDGDDFVFPTYIESLYEHLELHNDIDVLGFTHCSIINQDYWPETWNEPSDSRPSTYISPAFNPELYGLASENVGAQDRILLVSKSVLNYVLFFETVKVFEDFVLSLKLIQFHRLGLLKYYITACVDAYVYDTTADNTLTDEFSNWHKNFSAVTDLFEYVCWSDWSSFKDIPLIMPEPKNTIEERREYIQKNTIYSLMCLSFGTDQSKCKLLIDSATKFGYKLTMLGLGQKYLGYGQKINELKDFCEQSHPESVILFLDAYDTLFLRPNEEFIKEKQKLDLDNKVYFNAEKNCWPDGELASWFVDRYPESEYRYLNSGIIIGKAKNILKIIPEKVPEIFDDQRYYMHKMVFDRCDIIDLDTKQEFFMPLAYSVREIGYDGFNVFNTNTKTKPFLLHANFSEYVEETLSPVFGLLNLYDLPNPKRSPIKDEKERF